MDELGKYHALHTYCRSERYYSATVIPSILLYDNLALMPAFLDLVNKKAKWGSAPWGDSKPSHDTTEIVTEFDYVRDCQNMKDEEYEPDTEDAEKAEVARPDIFIVLNGEKRYLLSIECKFFQHSNVADIRSQIHNQRKVLHQMVKDKRFGFTSDCLFIGVLTQDAALEEKYRENSKDDAEAVDFFLTYDDILKILPSDLAENTQGLFYSQARSVLASAIKRYPPEPQVPWRLMDNLKSVIDAIYDASHKESKVYIGFTGGQRELAKVVNSPQGLEKLKTRRHWKILQERPPRTAGNWIEGNTFLKIILGESK